MREIQLLKRFVLSTVLVLALYTLTRILFLVMNPGLFHELAPSAVLLSFIYGLRFDLSALFMVNGFLFLVLVLFVEKKAWRWTFGKIYFTALNGFFLGLNIMDSEFFKFNGKRLTNDYLKNTEDIERQTLSVFVSYWWLTALFLVTLVVCYFLYRGVWKNKTDWPVVAWWRKALFSLAVIAVTVVAVRGGTQFKPISLVDGYAQGSQALGALVLNTPFTFIKGHGTGLGEAPIFIKDMKEARAVIENFRTAGHKEADFAALSSIKNVVVIVVESLSLEYTGLLSGQTSYTPFIDALGKKSLVFTNNHANGRRSIEAMPSIFCGLPSLVQAPIITTSLSQNELHCLPEIFSRHGFQTAFFHGAHNGSFHMDSFSAKAGFQKFYGFNEFPDAAAADDGHWGILDEPMFQFMAQTISAYKQPFFVGIFTLSSHHPYFIPEALRERFPEGPLEIHKSIGYLDYSLKRFFETAEKEPWFKNTLFVITGDHTQKNHEQRYQVLTGNYRVPLIFYSAAPEFQQRILSQRSSLEKKITQQVDIPATVLGVMGVEPAILLPPFGANALDAGERGLAVDFDGYQYFLRADHGAVAIDKAGHITKRIALDQDGFAEPGKELSSQDTEMQVGVLKALVSFFNEGMKSNTIYLRQKTARTDVKSPTGL
jgi:phosphoglycerol transferase MdoB-like AlkP superfamily enzyme